MEMNVGKSRVMRISRSSPSQIVIDQKQLDNVEYFKHLDRRCTHEIKSMIAMEKVSFNRKKILFTSKLHLNVRKKLVKCYIWNIDLYGAETWTLRKVD